MVQHGEATMVLIELAQAMLTPMALYGS
jgi:hypothetical protein